ncbi:hypothetical protein CA267_017305 [Alteromonas pelagimontana]|uniref:Uncharacterized protein n=1 Tax=Alteromonas pelagimontana TaxID=1858656 RepID=A0A6M4MH68_9ALTE|nr:hypothetical protein [Alteromonas pelagimontana]QJR82382.1 hypothetical protein CA267_017305 [Alteromonas pelagimontana]
MEKNAIGVLTGDIVNSQKIPPEHYEKLLYALNSTFSQLEKRCSIKFDIFRGDSFQIIFDNPSEAIEGAIILRLALKTSEPAFSVRQSIGIGKAMLLRHDVKSSTGEAFVLSGKGLDSMKNAYLTINSNDKLLQNKLTLLTKFVDAHLLGLTTIQAETLLCYITSANQSHEAVAKKLKKTRSNTTKLLLASRYQLIDEYCDYFKESVKEMNL